MRARKPLVALLQAMSGFFSGLWSRWTTRAGAECVTRNSWIKTGEVIVLVLVAAAIVGLAVPGRPEIALIVALAALISGVLWLAEDSGANRLELVGVPTTLRVGSVEVHVSSGLGAGPGARVLVDGVERTDVVAVRAEVTADGPARVTLELSPYGRRPIPTNEPCPG